MHLGRPKDLVVFDTQISGVGVRVYGDAPTDVRPVTVIYAHGGGFVVGDLDSHDDLCAEISDRTALRVISVDYRLAPEHQHPAAYNDLAAVVQAVCAQGPVVLAGDSAGATLCAALLGTLADWPIDATQIRGQVLIYPLLGYEPRGGSFDIHADAPLLSRDDLAVCAAARGGDPDDPRATPASGDLRALPSTRLFASQCDPLCDDATRYAEAAKTAGADVLCVTQIGTVHGWLRARARSPELAAQFTEIVEAIRDLAR
nr:alpha/beta hydrolase [Citreicella sp. C3M06]